MEKYGFASHYNWWTKQIFVTQAENL